MLHAWWDWKYYLRTFTMSSSHPCRYNPRSLTLRPVEKCQTWQRLSPGLPFGVKGLFILFSVGFLLKKTSRFQIPPDLPVVPFFLPSPHVVRLSSVTDIGTWLSARLPNTVWLRRWSCPKTWVQQCKSPTTYGTTYGRYLYIYIIPQRFVWLIR